MSQDLTIRRKVHFTRGQRSEKRARVGRPERPAVEPGRVPRVARLMALARHVRYNFNWRFNSNIRPASPLGLATV